jgi:AbrB family looped-hinge helix DNA binding protein
MQERGVITIPEDVRTKLGLQKGSTIVFIETADGRIEIRALAAVDMDLLDEIGTVLAEEGLDSEKWMALTRRNRRKLFLQNYPDLVD